MLTELGPKGMTVLEVGGGVGEIQVALLESGVAASAINIELSPNWEAAAKALLAERGLTDRVTRLNGDFVQEAAALPKADAVILHRVVCCYPNWQAMLTAATSRANRFVVVTFPRPRLCVQCDRGDRKRLPPPTQAPVPSLHPPTRVDDRAFERVRISGDR